jgi:hypothetical protein
MNNENQQPLSTQGNANEQEDQLGGTTNLSLDQLKDEGGIANPIEDNPDGLTDQGDLNEIRAADDLDEPDIEEYQPDNSEDDESIADQGTDDEHSSVNNADGNSTDEPANPTELNS